MSGTFTKPGVYLSEVLAAPAPSAGISLTNACFIGPNPRGPLPVAVCTSFQQFTSLYGPLSAGVVPTDLQLAVYQFFNNGGRQAYVIRVPDGNELAASVTLLDQEAATPQPTLTVTAANPGIWGNSLNVAVSPASDPTRFGFTVYYGGATVANVVERYTDLTLDPTDPRYAPAVLNAPTTGSSYVTLTDLAPTSTVAYANRIPTYTGSFAGATPALFTAVPVALFGGRSAAGAPPATAYDTALALVNQITNPVNLNLPGITNPLLVNKALTYAETRGDCFVVVDGITQNGSTAPTAPLQVTQAQAYAGVSPSTSYGAVYFPRIVIADPTSLVIGATRVVAQGGAVLGQYAASDAGHGVSKTPAGLGTRLTGVVGLEVALSDNDLSLLNISQVNAIRSLPGAGVVLMGGRTLTTTGKVDKYIGARRSLIYIKAQLEALTAFALFENNDQILQQQLTNTIEKFLLEFWQGGGLRGVSADQAFYVICDDTNNTAANRNNGEIRATVGVALQQPAEFVVIQIGQFDGTVNAVEAA